jgi:hypothetical protein
MAKLFSSQDPAHVHAIVGVACLVHIIGRIAGTLLFSWENMGFNGSVYNLACIVLHVGPNVTSFLFRNVPQRKPLATSATAMAIWKEYRWHSLIFAIRSWCCLLLSWIEQYNGPTQYAKVLRCVIVLLALYFAKYASAHNPQETTSIRGAYNSPGLRFFLSGAQFMATSDILLGGADTCFTNFVALAVIQLNAFNMTLQKKKIVHPLAAKVVYVLLLAGFAASNAFNLSIAYILRVHLLAFIAMRLRFSNVDRCTTWCGAYLLNSAVIFAGTRAVSSGAFSAFSSYFDLYF